MAKCRITYDKKGVASVENTIGTPSKLYEKILEVTEDQESALNAWSAAMTPESGLKGEATSINELLSFMDAHESTQTPLTSEEVANVTETMRRKGFETLSELSVELNRLFKPNGFVEMPPYGERLFTQDDLREINLTEVSQLIQRVDAHLTRKGEVFAKPYSQKDRYVDNTKKNIFGMSESISYTEMTSQIIESVADFSSEIEIERAVKASPFSRVIEKFNTNERYRRTFLDNLKSLRRIITLSVVAGELSADNNTHYTTVKNTITRDVVTTEVDAEMEYIASINNTIWKNNPSLVRDVLKEVESTLANMGVDVVGISEHVTSREVIIDILNEVSLMLRQPNHKNIKSFTDKLAILVPQKDNSVVELADARLEGLNIVHMQSDLSEAELFNKFGLIKVGEDIYHKVNQDTSIDTLVDFLATEYTRGDLELPKEYVRTKDLSDKVGVLEDVHTFLGAQSEIVGLNDKSKYTAYKIAFGHTTIRRSVDNIRSFSEIETNTEYLKTSFVTDFYNYILKEKVKDSPTYRNILSKFAITDKDISLTGRVQSIEGIEFEKEFKDYIRLKRGDKMRYLLGSTQNHPANEDMLVLNFPETVKELTGEYMPHGKHIVLPQSSELYVKVDGELYRKAARNEHSDVFTKITSPQSNIYYTNNANFTFDKTQAIKVLDTHQSLNTPKELNIEESQVNKKMFGGTNNIEDYSTILDSSIKVVNLYTENEESTIREQLDECAG